MKEINNKTNNLILQESPYLQQHAYNPVAWEPWSKSVLKRAQEEKKLIFLSIGYSTCHWCHVMEKESFEDEGVAAILNKYYVSIKVDREEMPHLDKHFQEVHNLLNKRAGGWPLSAVLTPDAKAFFVATYIPKEPRHGMSGFKELLLHIKGLWDRDEEKIRQSSLQIEEVLKEHKTKLANSSTPLDIELVRDFVEEVEESFDTKYFGIGDAPKFPHASSIETLLDIYLLQKNSQALDMATSMLKAMARGGINDQIEGGFYRYSVDAAWQVPHFEKMLYTNGELLSAYAKAFMITKEPLFKEVMDSIIEFVDERFAKKRLFFAASDADSFVGKEKKEGAYFVFTYEESFDFLLEKGFSQGETVEALSYFNITKEGNFEGKSTNPYLNSQTKPPKVKEIKSALKELRLQREYPFVDEKVLTSWNALYITGLLQASKVKKSYEAKALEHLDALLQALHVKKRLYHQRLVEKPPKVDALLEDYAFLIEALLQGYEVSLKVGYLKKATSLCKEAIERFYQEKSWFMSSDAFKTMESPYDNSYKSPLATMADNLLRLALYTEELEYQALAEELLQRNSTLMSNAPSNTPSLVGAFLKQSMGYVSLQSIKENLENINVPLNALVVKKVINEKGYKLCGVSSCFAHKKSLEEILEVLDRRV